MRRVSGWREKNRRNKEDESGGEKAGRGSTKKGEWEVRWRVEKSRWGLRNVRDCKGR